MGYFSVPFDFLSSVCVYIYVYEFFISNFCRFLSNTMDRVTENKAGKKDEKWGRKVIGNQR